MPSMQFLELPVKSRKASGKGEAGRLRRTGYTPAILYGRETANVALAIEERLLEKATRSGGHLVKLVAEDGEHLAMIKELVSHPLSRRPVHVDFLRISLKENIRMQVPVHLVGAAPGVKEGGILDRPSRTLEVESLPTAMPEAIEVDISALEINGSLHVRDLPANDQYRILDDPDTPLVTCHVQAEEAAPAVEGEEAEAAPGSAEPEVIGAKKPEADAEKEKEKK